MQVSKNSIESILHTHNPHIVVSVEQLTPAMKGLQLLAVWKRSIHQFWFCMAVHMQRSLPMITLRHIQDIDIVVRGEGELTTHRLAKQVLHGNSDFANIPGISYRKENTIVHMRMSNVFRI